MSTSTTKKIAAVIASAILICSSVGMLSVIGGGGESDSEIGIGEVQAAEINPASVVATGTLDEKRNAARDEALTNFKFAETNLPKWNGTETACYKTSTKTFDVDSPEDFAYALHYAGSYAGATINILSDIDMDGRNFVNTVMWNNIAIKGNHHTIYNYKSDQNQNNVGLCVVAYRCSIENINFTSAFLKGNNGVGLFPRVLYSASIAGSSIANNTFSAINIHLENCLAMATSSASNEGHVGCFLGYGECGPMGTLSNISQNGCVSIGNNHIGGLFGMYDHFKISNCYTENSLIISNGGHSGALAGCSNRYNEFENCWSNSTIYGNTEVGGFTSGCDEGATYTNCFSFGIVEANGIAGGFVGFIGKPRYISAGYTYTNCYSTAMVGMNYSGTSLGGFVGHVYGYDTKYSLINCYAAGEVGSIDTNTDSICGGFAGANDATTIEFKNCFYDMQNTATQNKIIGNLSTAPIERNPSLSSTLSNIKGVDTESLISNPLGASYTSSHGLYPQLASMANHSNPKFRAASAASVATVFCDTWGDLGTSSTAFDTVRDTIRPLAFSSTTPFTSNPSFSAAYVEDPHITNITWETDGNTSPLDNTTPVVSLTESSPYYSTSLAPGIEWLTVTVEYTTDDGTKETASRRVRLIPTSTMKIGSDARIDVYDDESMTDSFAQQDGFSATYLDATTLRDYILSNKTHPEALVFFPSPYAKTATSAYGTSLLPFNASTKNMDISSTIAQAGDNATDEDLLARDITAKMCGEKKFANSDLGTYTISYKAAIPDGRYLSDSRKVIVLNQYSVVYYYNYTGMLAGSTISPESIFAYQGSLRNYINFDYTSPYDEEDLIRDGWRFSYWSLDPEGKQPVTQRYFDEYEERHGTLDHNTNLYAQWNRLMPNTETTLAVDPKDGMYPGSDTSEVKMFSGAPGDRIAIDSATAPLLFSFDKWAGTELGGGMLEYSEDTDTWLFTFGDEPARIDATYTPLFEDNGLVIGGKKIFEDGELAGSDFEFELVPFRDALRDPYQMPITTFGDSIDDSRQAQVTFHVTNGEFMVSGRGIDYSTVMTIRDKDGELLPEFERMIVAGSEHYTPPMQNTGYDGTAYWTPYDPTSHPIDGDIEFTCEFKPTGLPDIPAPDIPVPDVPDMPADVGVVPFAGGDVMDSVVTANTSNDVDGNFSFDELDLTRDGIMSGNKDGYTYFCFKLREVEDDDSFVSYDKREYVVQVQSVLYNGRYVPTDISYWCEGDAGYLERVREDDVAFVNKKLWIQMPETGSIAGVIALDIGIVTSIAALALISVNGIKKRRSAKKRP